MKITSILGLILGFGLVFLAISQRGDVMMFLQWESIAIVLGGTVSATLLSFNSDQIAIALRSVRVVFIGRTPAPDELIPTMVQMVQQARIQGANGLDIGKDVGGRLRFLKKAIGLLDDGFDPDDVAQILKAESDSEAARYRMSERLFSVMGNYSPLFGLLGTLIGLVIMLSSISDPKAIPGAMAIAMLTTFYGVIFSALIFRPIATKIRAWNYDEILLRELVIETLLYIADGVNSSIAQERLESYFLKKRPA